MRYDVAKLEGPRALVWETQDGPDELNGFDIRCRTLYSAISPGTEVAAYIGLPPLRPGPIYPRVVGYCNVAQVVSVGSQVTKVNPGDLVITHQSHRSGFVCQEGAALCTVDPSADLTAVSTAYLFHLGYAGLLAGNFRPGHSVAIIGLGPIGLATTGVIAASGGLASGFSNQASSREMANRMGAVASFHKRSEPMKDHFDIVVTTSNSWSDWKLALELARFGGTIAVIGFPGRGEEPVDFNPLASEYLYDKQLTITACGMVPNIDVKPSEVRFTIKRNMKWLVDLIQSDRLPANLLVSETIEARQLDAMYERMARREDGLVTAVLEW